MIQVIRMSRVKFNEIYNKNGKGTLIASMDITSFSRYERGAMREGIDTMYNLVKLLHEAKLEEADKNE